MATVETKVRPNTCILLHIAMYCCRAGATHAIEGTHDIDLSKCGILHCFSKTLDTFVFACHKYKYTLIVEPIL